VVGWTTAEQEAGAVLFGIFPDQTDQSYGARLVKGDQGLIECDQGRPAKEGEDQGELFGHSAGPGRQPGIHPGADTEPADQAGSLPGSGLQDLAVERDQVFAGKKSGIQRFGIGPADEAAVIDRFPALAATGDKDISFKGDDGRDHAQEGGLAHAVLALQPIDIFIQGFGGDGKQRRGSKGFLRRTKFKHA
jgi:hypothetical protein